MEIILFILGFTFAVAVVIKIFSDTEWEKCFLYALGVVIIIALLLITRGLFAPFGYFGYRYYRGNW